MSSFVIIAALLTLAALALLAWPLLRRRAELPPAWLLLGLAGVLVIGGGAALYPTWSSWDWSEPALAADSPAAMVGRLARRLEKQPDDLQGWLLLGRSYAVIQQHSLSARAYQRADKLANGRNVEALLGLGDALISAGRSDVHGVAGRLFEKALEIEPDSVEALLYGALVAKERNDLPLARQRFMKLLEGNPPPEARRVIEEQLREVDAMALLAGPGDTRQSASAAGSAAAPATAAAVVTVPLRVTLATGVAARAAAGAPLFVLARVPGQRGMPLAAKRLEASFPQDIALLSTDAAMGGGGFTAGQELEIEARIANGGTAISRSGDPFGVVRVKAGTKGRISIEINQLKP